MRLRNRVRARILVVFVAGLTAAVGLARAQQGAPGLTEEKMFRMIDLRLKPEVIASVIRRQGLGFPVDAAILDRLKQADVPDLVVEAVRAAGEAKPAAAGKPVTYQDVADLLGLGVPEGEVLARLEQSPTTFTLSKEQSDALARLGATEKLLNAMGSVRTSFTASSELNNLAIVFDCSRSMSEMTAQGRTKMVAAREAAIELVRDVPEGVRLAFVVYGHDRAMECNAIRVIRELEPLDDAGRAALIAMIGRLQPVGSTPIALALRVAGRELAKANAPSGLVLISDGKEMCGGDPTSEAAALTRTLKLEFGVQVVGFGVKPDEQQALGEIARAGNGRYHDAPTPESLREVVRVLSRRIEEAKAAPQLRRATAVRASTDVNRPTPLELGVMAKARIDSGSRTNRSHYWLVDLPKGDFKVVVDETRSDKTCSNIQGAVSWLRTDGTVVSQLVGLNAIDFRTRALGRIHLDEPQPAVISVEAGSGMVDYDIAVFDASGGVPTPYLRNSPTVTPIAFGQTFTSQVLVPGSGKNCGAYCSITLPPGDYKVTCELRRVDGAATNLQGSIALLSPDGEELSSVGTFNEIAPRATKSFKLIVSEELDRIFCISPSAEMTATLKIEPLSAE